MVIPENFIERCVEKKSSKIKPFLPRHGIKWVTFWGYTNVNLIIDNKNYNFTMRIQKNIHFK